MTYRVTATRWDRGWELDVEGYGTTQCHALDAATSMVRDFVRLDGASDWETADIELTIDLGGFERDVALARKEVRDAADAQRNAAEHSRQIARQLRESGLSVTDTAVVLGVSRGRVSQLTA